MKPEPGVRIDHSVRRRRPRAQPGPQAVRWPRRPGSCTALYEAAPPAVGPTGTTGRARAAEATRRYMHIWAPPAAGAAGPIGNVGPRAGRRSCATRSGPMRLRKRISAPPAAGPARGPWAASGPEELRGSERSHGCRRDTVTVCFQYLVPQATVDDSTFYSELALLHSELGVAIRIVPFELWTRVLKQTAMKLDLSSYNPNRVSVVDIVSSSEDSLRSSRNSVQALLEPRYCSQSTWLNSPCARLTSFPTVCFNPY